MNRTHIDKKVVSNALSRVGGKLNHRLLEKGQHTFSSRHEILGILDEEYHELNDAVRSGTKDELREELLDIAVAATFAVACLDADTLDW